jgi:hypothetical protein
MKVEFKDSFFESVEKLVWYDTKLWKVWAAIRYDIPLFFKNVWRFRKELYNHQWWDYRYTLEMLHRSLVIMEAKMHDGMEIRESRDKKIAKMQRAIQILKNIIDDNYIEMAESELGKLVMRDWEFEDVPDRPGCSKLVDNETASEKRHNRKVFNRARKLEAMEWNELWKIFEGQNIQGYKKLSKSLKPEEHKNRDVWNEWFDGSDLRGWWD